MPTDEERIEGLEADAIQSYQQIEGMKTEATRRGVQIDGMEAEATRRDALIEGLDAEAILRDERIVALLDEVESLQRAVGHRAVIEQAKGVIMGSTGCGPEAAFAVLVLQSQNQKRAVWEIATDLTNAQDGQRRQTEF